MTVTTRTAGVRAWECVDCHAAYPPGERFCPTPWCKSERRKEPDDVAKISRTQGRSVAGAVAGEGNGGGEAAAAQPAPTADTASGGPSNNDVREWAWANGYEVSPRGRLPRDVIDAYEAAHVAQADDQDEQTADTASSDQDLIDHDEG